MQVPDLALFLALAAVAEQRGLQIPSVRKAQGQHLVPCSEQSRVREEAPSALQGAAARTLPPLQHLPSLQHVQPWMIHVASPSKRWAKFKSSGVWSVPPLLSGGVKRKLTGPLWSPVSLSHGSGKLCQEGMDTPRTPLSHVLRLQEALCLHTLGTPHQAVPKPGLWLTATPGPKMPRNSFVFTAERRNANIHASMSPHVYACQINKTLL